MPTIPQPIAAPRWKVDVLLADTKALYRICAESGMSINQVKGLLDLERLPKNPLVSEAFQRQAEVELAKIHRPADMESG